MTVAAATARKSPRRPGASSVTYAYVAQTATGNSAYPRRKYQWPARSRV
jgi:hypothetical protein